MLGQVFYCSGHLREGLILFLNLKSAISNPCLFVPFRLEEVGEAAHQLLSHWERLGEGAKACIAKSQA